MNAPTNVPAIRSEPNCLAGVVLTLTLAVAHGACADLHSQASGTPRIAVPKVVSRTGVTTYLHPKGAWERAQQLRLDPAPITVIGGQLGAPDFDLTGVLDVALLDDGGIAAAARSGGVMIFDRLGKGVRVIGRRGTGPGEFANARMVRLAADTLLMVDLGTLRITRLTPGGAVVGSESLGERLPAAAGRPLGLLPDGTLVLTSAGSWSVLPDKKLRGQSNASVVVLRKGQKGAVLGMLPDVELVTVETRAGGIKKPLLDQVRFGLRAQIAIWDTLIVTTDGAAYRVDLRDRTWRIVRSLEVAVERAATTSAQRRAGLAIELAAFDANSKHSQIPLEARRLIQEAPYASLLPAISKVLVGQDGTLWVVDGMTQFDTAWTATAFRNDGAMVGRLRGNGGVPVSFGRGVVLIKATDEDGVVRFEVRRILGG